MVSLYELSAGNFARMLDASIVVLEKGQKHLLESGQELEEMVEMKLAPDMLPFSFQVNSIRHHTLHAAQGVINGHFSPPEPLPEDIDYAGLLNLLEVAKSDLKDISEADINACEGKQVTFKMGSMEIPFTAENFVQAFSLPNLYFHAATAYDMLRMKGTPLGKMDFMGKMPVGV